MTVLGAPKELDNNFWFAGKPYVHTFDSCAFYCQRVAEQKKSGGNVHRPPLEPEGRITVFIFHPWWCSVESPPIPPRRQAVGSTRVLDQTGFEIVLVYGQRLFSQFNFCIFYITEYFKYQSSIRKIKSDFNNKIHKGLK